MTVCEGVDDCAGGGGGGGGDCDDYTNDCSNPEMLAGPGDYAFDTSCAFAAGDRNFDTTGVCDPGDFGDDICYNTYYFQFTAASDGNYEFTTCNQADYDTRLVIASTCDPATTVACNDDGTDDTGTACVGFSSRIQTSLSAGTYIVGVGGYGTGNSGTGILTVIGDAEPPEECIGDLNMDGQVDGGDLFILLGAWDGIGGDLNGDLVTDGADLNILLGAWGFCP